MNNTTSILAILGSMAVAACGSTSGSQGELDTSSVLSALEMNEDGSNLENADAVEAQPQLGRGCELGDLVRRHHGGHDHDGGAPPDQQGSWEGHGDFHGDAGARPPMDFGGHDEGHPPFGGDAGMPPMGDAPEQGNPARQHRIDRLRNKFDADQSGDLNESERGALRHELQRRCEQRHSHLVGQFDANGDGQLNDQEWSAAHNAISQSHAEQHAQLVGQFDANGDGQLNDQEKHAAQEHIVRQMDAAESGADAGGPPQRRR